MDQGEIRKRNSLVTYRRNGIQGILQRSLNLLNNGIDSKFLNNDELRDLFHIEAKIAELKYKVKDGSIDE